MKKFIYIYVLLFIIISILSPHPVNAFSTKDIYIKSEGANNGWVSVRVCYPSSPTSYRYKSNTAPILVFVPGGYNAGSLPLGPGLNDLPNKGFVVIRFLFPGGVDPAPARSQGTFDYRGINCIKTLRDVLLFAQGLSTESTGKAINQLTGGTLLINQVGLLTESNGGPIIMTTLDIYGNSLPYIKYFVGVEDPTNDQSINLDFGWRKYDCITTDLDSTGSDQNNVKYISYGNPQCLLDYSTLAYDSLYAMGYPDSAQASQPTIYQSGVLFFDNSVNHKIDTTGNGCYDINGNGKLDIGDDYPFFAIPTFTNGTNIQIHYSMSLLSQATAKNILNVSKWPKHIATISETSAFWYYRDATLHFSKFTSRPFTLHSMLIYAIRDHAQTQSDKPHIQQAYDNFRGQKIWTRLNPDTTYLQYVLQTTLPNGTPDNDANMTVTPGTIGNYSEPYEMLSYPMTSIEEAGVCEMADRCYFGNWENNVSSMITVTPTFVPKWNDTNPLD